jgi:hypothetical protein
MRQSTVLLLVQIIQKAIGGERRKLSSNHFIEHGMGCSFQNTSWAAVLFSYFSFSWADRQQ